MSTKSTHTDSSRTTLTTLLIAALALGSFGCDGETTPEAMNATRTALVTDFVDYVLLPQYDAFVLSSATLATETARYANSQTPEGLEAARAAWRTAANDWQEAELMNVGPSEAATEPGGEDRRDNVYAWPLVNPCRIDQETLEPAHTDTALLADELVNVRGLFAIEYLLFDVDEENACSAVSSINSQGRWAAERENIAARRARYAASAAELVAAEATTLRARWNEFRTQIESTPSDTYDNDQQAVNAISDALFYLDTVTKDLKLALPAGISTDCDQDVCPERRESIYALGSLAHVQANLRGFALVFRGAENRTGFEELLEDAGAGEVADAMNTAIDNAIEQSNAIEGDIPTLLSANPRALMPLYDAVKAITDILKSAPFLMPLEISVPQEAAGDSD